MNKIARRKVLALAGAAMPLAAGVSPVLAADEQNGSAQNESAQSGGEQNAVIVTANEDLMREHGVLRRVLLVYRAAAQRAHTVPERIPQQALHAAATLFRDFGEDYHERKLEEAYIFPAIRKARPDLAMLVGTLQTQHARGRQITDYILDIASREIFPTAEARRFAKAMGELDWMYQNHAAREDTIVFPAWKEALGAERYGEMGQNFETIEQQSFGQDGFEAAVQRIAMIEAEFELSDLMRMTAPPPPRI